jgi:hypothetical protein
VFHSDPGLIEHTLVLRNDPRKVRAKEHGGDFESELIQIGVARQVARQTRLVQGARELRDP